MVHIKSFGRIMDQFRINLSEGVQEGCDWSKLTPSNIRG